MEVEMEGVNGTDNVASEKKYCKSELNLAFNNLKSVPEFVIKLKHLRILNLSNNLLNEIPSQIKNLKSLLSLDLSYNQLEKLPQSLSEMTQLKYINLSHNKFSDVPPILLESLQFIRVLDLSHNEIMYFTDPPSCMSNLVELSLSQNKLMKIPNWIFGAKCIIKNFDISHNRLSCMTENFLSGNVLIKLMTKLELLNLQNCGLSSESLQFISNMTALETLKLGNNEAHIINRNHLDNLNLEIFEKCIRLKNLHLNYCQISVLPNNFDCFKDLQYLNLEGNNLSWLPDSFCNLHSLSVCYLSKNSISFLPQEFGKLINLKELYLNNNILIDIPDYFSLLVNLEYCDLYGNKLEYINPSFINLQSLKGIDLGCNCLDFKSLCHNEETYNQFILKYSVFKESLRQKINKNRLDLQILEKEIVAPVENEAYTPCSDEELDIILNNSGKPQAKTENFDENWDEVNPKTTSPGMEHDDFDPNVNYCSSLKWKKANRKNPFHSNFCPADNHIPSIRKYFLRKPKDVPVEGQYDLN